MSGQQIEFTLQELSARWDVVVANALDRNAGALLSGLVHNLHNYAHTLSMQIEMWTNSLSRNAQASIGSFQRSFERMGSLSSDFTTECQILSERAVYSSFEPALLNVGAAIDWLNRFWVHHLFFKHHVQLAVSIESHVPEEMCLVPAPFIYCVEEGLKNAVEALTQYSPQIDPFRINLQVDRSENGIHLSLNSPTTLEKDLDPWQPGSSTKSGHLGLGLPLVDICCRKMGWDCNLAVGEWGTILHLTIPQQNSAGQDLARTRE